VHLESISLRDFRNVPLADLDLHPRFNVLAGDNGQGKTNLLESVYWLSTLRPFRASRLRELVRWGQPGCRVRGVSTGDGLQHRLSCGVDGNERIAEREGKRCRAADYFGALSVVLFTPEDVGLVRGPPSDRRRFLDRAIFTGRPSHLSDVLGYRRALEGRNRLLRESAPDDLVAAFEGPLAAAGARLVEARRAYVDALRPGFETTFAAVMGAELVGRLEYRPGLNTDPAGAEALASAWAEDRERDRQRGFTQRGPHTDDLGLKLLERPARAYASQGQQRTMVLALKIAEIGLLEAQHSVSPVLLLDDVSSELDPGRNERLFEFLEGYGGQVLITTTNPQVLRIGAQQRTFLVRAGAVDAVEG
jgi:DNA replication and repair protein RecF